jgi:hypothetical protein
VLDEIGITGSGIKLSECPGTVMAHWKVLVGLGASMAVLPGPGARLSAPLVCAAVIPSVEVVAKGVIGKGAKSNSSGAGEPVLGILADVCHVEAVIDEGYHVGVEHANQLARVREGRLPPVLVLNASIIGKSVVVVPVLLGVLCQNKRSVEEGKVKECKKMYFFAVRANHSEGGAEPRVNT